MSGAWLSELVRRLRHDPAGGDGGTDADLLRRFARDRDEGAFELLVWRHGGMVLAACRRALGRHHDAADAFPATFLVLARSAGRIGRGAALPAWLHRVAVRIAARAARRRRGASPLVSDVAAPPAADPVAGAEVAAILDAEIDALPERLRRAVVLCYLQGLTAAEAGRRLGCPAGTVESRLAAARRTLRVRLGQRGITAAVGPFAGVVGEAVLAPEAVARAVRGGVAFVTGGTTVGVPVQLAKGELAMAGQRLWAGVGAVGLAVAAGAGIGYGSGWADGPAPGGDPPAAKPTPVPPPKATDAKPAEPAKAEAWPLARQPVGFDGQLVGVTPDGRSVVMITMGLVFGIALSNGDATFRIESPNPVSDAAVSPDGKLLATAEGANGVKLRALPSGELIEALWPSAGLPAGQLAFTPNGKHLIGLCRGPHGPVAGLRPGAPNRAQALKYQLAVWEVATRKDVSHGAEVIDPPGSLPPSVVMAGSRFALRSEPFANPGAPAPREPLPEVRVIDAVTGVAGKPFVLPPFLVLAIGTRAAVSSDGKTVLALQVAQTDQPRTILFLIDPATGNPRHRLGGQRLPIRAAAFSPDGKLVAAVTGLSRTAQDSHPVGEAVPAGPSELVVWDTATGKEVARVADKDTIRSYTALAFGPDGRSLVALDDSNTLSVWGRPPGPAVADPKPVAAGGKQADAGAGVPDRFVALLQELSADGVTDARRVEAVFLAALGRLPTDTEAKALAAQLGRQADKAAAARELLNTLVGTAEFKAHAAALGRLAK